MHHEPSAFLLIGRGIMRGLKGLHSQRSWGALFGALLATFLLLQVMLLIFVATEGVQNFLRSQTDLRLEVREDAEKPDITAFFTAVQGLPYVEESVYVTSEQAYERMKMEDPDIIDILESFQLANPFPETIGITLASLDHYAEFARFLKQPQWQTVVDPTFLSQATDQESHVLELMTITTLARSFTLVLVGVVSVVLLMIITSLARARAQERRNEILVEHLVGARPVGILSPFIMEAVMLCFVCTVCTVAILGGLLWGMSFVFNTPGLLTSLVQFMGPVLQQFAPWFIIGECIGIPLVATIGTYLAMHGYLTKRTLAF